MAAPPILNTYQSLITTFSDFLTVAIHTIIYERNLYPASTFLSTRKYNLPVRQNRHPKVCKWIQDAVAAVEGQMLKGAVSRVVVPIYSPQLEVMERFLFDVSSFPTVPANEIFTPLEREGSAGEELRISLVDIEEQLRATIRKLAVCGSKLGPLPDGCTYTVAVELKDKAPPPIGHPQPWVPSEPSLQTGEKGKSSRIGSDLGGVATTPVRSVEAGEFILESWIEEGSAKYREIREEAGDLPY
ncbi:DNA-binding protein [Xylogone sp. PMI_703]|nr:DNA-binding protein [Xylogone sp. PMI_703]